MDKEKKNGKMQTAASHFCLEENPDVVPIPCEDSFFITELVRAMPDGVMMEVYFDGRDKQRT